MNNPQQREEVRSLYRQFGGNIHKVCQELSDRYGVRVRPADISKAVAPNAVVLRDVSEDTPKPEKDENGYIALGRPELRPFIVSYRHCCGMWPEEDRFRLNAARRAYDAGTHIMTQGRDGAWIIQYLWKRTRAVAPVNWFYGAFA